MRKSRFSDEQIVKILGEAESGKSTVEALVKKHGIAETTYYRWKAKFAGASQTELTRLRELERENARLKKLVVDRDLEIEVMKEIAAKKW